MMYARWPDGRLMLRFDEALDELVLVYRESGCDMGTIQCDLFAKAVAVARENEDRGDQ